MTHPMLLAAVRPAALAPQAACRGTHRGRPFLAGPRTWSVFGALLWYLSLCSAALARPAPPLCEVLLLNNPAASLQVYHPVAGEQLTLEGFASTWVRVSGLPRQEKVVLRATAVDAAGAALATDRAEVTSEAGAASWRHRLRAPLPAPVALQVEVTQGPEMWTYREQVRLHRLSGRITDFRGQPRRLCDGAGIRWAAGEGERGGGL